MLRHRKTEKVKRIPDLPMRVLLDTNIIIYREDYKRVSPNLNELLYLIAENKVNALIHPLAFAEIKRDQNIERRDIILSKLKSYQTLESPPDPEQDAVFRQKIKRKDSPNELVDDNLLYCVYRDAIDFLITHDGGIKEKALRIGIHDRVYSIDEALVFLKRQYKSPDLSVAPLSIAHLPLHNLSLNDAIFNQLKTEYPDFSDWYKSKSTAGQKAWVFLREDKTIGAFLMLKEENEVVESINSTISKNKRVKISTLIVAEHGYKIGELFIKISIEFAISKSIDEIYLTHFDKPENDYLVPLISEFGFEKVGQNQRGETIYLKRLRPVTTPDSAEDFYLKCYPSFQDGIDQNKFIVPIVPAYHKKLFPELDIELKLFADGLFAEGNSIKKAYLSHAVTKQIKPRDILLFYRSQDNREITSLGIVEQVFTEMTSWAEAVKVTSKRTVFNETELKAILLEPTLILLFRWHFHLIQPLKYENLMAADILKGPPQSISMITHENYLQIKKLGGISERFTFD